MPQPYIEALRSFSGSAGASLETLSEADRLVLRRDQVTVTVTVPHEVLEWFVEIGDDDGHAAEDWVDYAGFDDTPPGQLSQNMANDLREFLLAITSRSLRLTPRSNAKGILEWEVDDNWKQAIPFTSETAQLPP